MRRAISSTGEHLHLFNEEELRAEAEAAALTMSPCLTATDYGSCLFMRSYVALRAVATLGDAAVVAAGASQEK